MDMEEGTNIWEHFQRFAEYDDLKSLHDRVLPEIAKFETKLLMFKKELMQTELIIRQFDEVMQTKSNKMRLEELWNHVMVNCSDKKEQE